MDSEIIKDQTGDSDTDVLEFSDQFYDYFWNIAKESLIGTSAENITKEEFKQRYFTRGFAKEKLRINDWIPLEGCSYPITIERTSAITFFILSPP